MISHNFGSVAFRAALFIGTFLSRPVDAEVPKLVPGLNKIDHVELEVDAM